MEIKDEKINKILEKSKKYREQLASNMNCFINTEKEFADFGEIFEKNLKKDIKNIDLNDEPEKKISMNCFKPYECAYWNYCTKDLPKNNVFNIRLMHKDKKFKLYNEGKISFEDILYEDINEKY